MDDEWIRIRVPLGADTTPWLEDEYWQNALRLLLDRCQENQRRSVVGLLSIMIGHGGQKRLSEITGMHVETIMAGRRELKSEFADSPPDRVRRPGAGRKRKEKETPEIESALREILEEDKAGDPSSADVWTRKSLRELQKALAERGHSICRETIRRLVKKTAMGCTPTANASPVHPTRTETHNSSTSRHKSKIS
jgi:hypothetical protein